MQSLFPAAAHPHQLVARGNRECCAGNHASALSLYELASCFGSRDGQLNACTVREALLCEDDSTDSTCDDDDDACELQDCDEIPRASLLRDVTALSDKPGAAAKRCLRLLQGGDVRTADADAAALLAAGDTSALLWHVRAEAAWAARDGAALAALCAELDRDGRCPEAFRARSCWLAGDYARADVYASAAVADDEAGAVLMRAEFNRARGRISRVVQDDPHDALVLFSRKLFPVKLSQKVLLRFPYLNDVLCYYHDSFRRGFDALPLSMGIPLCVQAAWVRGAPVRVGNVAELENIEELPDGFVCQICDAGVIARVIESGRQFGATVDGELINARAVVCKGLAVLELAQGIWRTTSGGDAVVMSFRDVEFTVMSWLRLIDPVVPVFLQNRIVRSKQRMYIVRNGFKTDMYHRFGEVFGILKQHFGNIGCLRNKIKEINTVEGIWNVVGKDTIIPLENSKCSVFMTSKKFNQIDFGISLDEESLEERIKLNEKILIMWYDLLNSVKFQSVNELEIMQKIFLFLYYWLRAAPFTNCSAVAGSIITIALLFSLCQILPEKSFPAPFDLQFDALLSSNFNDFLNRLKKYDIKIKRNDSKDFININEVMPNFYVRIQTLREIPED